MTLLDFWRRRMPSGELPMPEVLLNASLPHADEREVQQEAVAANPSRLLVRQQCWRCRHYWQAPVKGNCPRCHCPIVEVLEVLPCMAAKI